MADPVTTAAKIGKGGLAAGGLLGFFGLAAPSLIEGVKGSLERGKALADFVDSPDLLRAKFDEQSRDGAFDALLRDVRRQKLAAIVSANPRLAATLRALQMGSPQPRLTGSEVRIGGTNSTDAVDERIVSSNLLDRF